MRILHLADLHLGLKLGNQLSGLSLLPEQAADLERVVALAEAEQVDVCLIAGDIYHHSRPSVEARTVLDRFLTSLHRLGIATLMVPGNHDSAEGLSFLSEILGENEIYIPQSISAYQVKLTEDPFVMRVRLERAGLCVDFDLLPFLRSIDLSAFEPEVLPRTTEAAVACALREIGQHHATEPAADFSVLVAHQLVTSSGIRPELASSERLYIGATDEVSAELFSAYDYVALGHIHRPQALSDERCRYAGALWPFRFSEIGIERSIPLLELERGQRPRLCLLPFCPAYELRRWRGALADLKREAREESLEFTRLKEVYSEVILTDRPLPPDAYAQISELLPRLVQLTLAEREEKTELEQIFEEPELEMTTLFKRFAEEQGGRALTAAEEKIIDIVGAEICGH